MTNSTFLSYVLGDDAVKFLHGVKSNNRIQAMCMQSNMKQNMLIYCNVDIAQC